MSEEIDVVAYRYTASRSFGKSYQVWHYQEKFPAAGCRKVEEIGRIDELMTVAQHQRIVEQLRKDTERMDWLDSKGNSYGFEGIHEGNEYSISGPYKNIRDAIDSAIEQSK